MVNPEKEIASWLKKHRSGLEKDVHSRHNPAYHLFPDTLFHIYIDTYADNVLTIVRTHLQNSELNLNPEEINCIVTKEWLTILFGKKFLCPPAIKKEFDNGSEDKV